MITGRRDRLDSFGQLGTRNQDASSAGETANADVGAQAHNLPLMTATRVWLSQIQNIAHLEVHCYRQDDVSSLRQVMALLKKNDMDPGNREFSCFVRTQVS